jgi:hypothetical protein
MLALGGCASTYYRVTDPVSGQVYYTEKVEFKKSGSATFTDVKTNSMVTITNSVVKEINEDEFNVGRYEQAKPAAAPSAATTAPATTTPPAATTPPATTTPPAATTAPATTEPAATTTAPATTTPPAATTPPATTTPTTTQ